VAAGMLVRRLCARAASRTLPRLLLRNPQSRTLQTSARTDGFNEALPRRDVVAPIFCGAIFGFSWWMAEEGTIEPLVENIEMNTDPQAWPTPKQILHHLWPLLAGNFAMMFESVACKFTQTKDMTWLCTTAMNDDLKATVALCLLVAPAEHSPAFVRAMCEQGTMPRLRDIVQIYKTLPREQHDDVLTNACIIACKLAAMPDLRDQGLSIADFLWMAPQESAYQYTPYGIEGLAHLWQSQSAEFLRKGGYLRISELTAGPPLRPSKKDSSIVNQELAGRLLARTAECSSELHAEAAKLEAALSRAERVAGPASGKRTIWQATGVHRGETEAELARKERQAQILTLQSTLELLERNKGLPSETLLERFGVGINVLSSAVLGMVYGTLRGYGRGWWQDVTPSVCRELALHVGRRTAVGSALLVGLFEAAPWIKQQVLDALGRQPVLSYKQEGALEQLLCIDMAYLGALAVVNFCFPYVLVPVAWNPTQLLLPPNDCVVPAATPAASKVAPS